MLEVRYNKDTKEVTGWCGDPKEFGNLKKRGGVEEVVLLDIPIPNNLCIAYLYDEATRTLKDNPDYVQATIRNPLAEIDDLKARMER